MAIAVFGTTLLGGEAQRKQEAANEFASKYPLSNDINEIQANIAKANVELTNIKNASAKTAGAKRIRTRRANALSAWIVKMQNSIKDLQAGISNSITNMVIAAPTPAANPTAPMGTNVLTYNPLTTPSVDTILRTPLYQGEATTVSEAVSETPTTPETKKSVWGQVALYGGIFVVVVTAAYFIMKKKK